MKERQIFNMEYWPLVLVGSFVVYKTYRSIVVKKKLPDLKKRGAYFLDVRSEPEYGSACASCTVNIPLQDLSKRMHEIPKDVPVVVCCASGTRSAMAMALLKKQGIKEVYNIGSWRQLS